ncbi:hypothetical protein ACIQM0_38440 [Streptomyces sp. NPDC091387]|uniref:hypothetical protein n=1 Tax=Streptomyces sp. NPDC091387 TaxID=3365998 RepID=UPI003806F556
MLVGPADRVLPAGGPDHIYRRFGLLPGYGRYCRSTLAHRPESVAGAEPLFRQALQRNLLDTFPGAYDYLRRLHGQAGVR